MIVESARKAASGLLDSRSRAVVIKSLALTILLFFGLWFALQSVVNIYVDPLLQSWAWITTALLWFLGAGLVVGAGFLLAPVTAVFAGLFLDEVAEHVESVHYPTDPPGTAMALPPSILLAIKFGLLVVFANLLALLLVWVAGFGVIIFFLLNGYLLGREYFQFAAMRFRSEREAETLRKSFSFEVIGAGLIIAAFMSVPVLNLLTPVFAASMMVHLHKAVESSSA